MHRAEITPGEESFVLACRAPCMGLIACVVVVVGGGPGPGGVLMLDDRRNMIASASAPLNPCSGMFNTPLTSSI